jgi:hypothetical protein
MCFDCVVDYEAELRKAGLYESYERNMMQGSMKAFARDVPQANTAQNQMNCQLIVQLIPILMKAKLHAKCAH